MGNRRRDRSPPGGGDGRRGRMQMLPPSWHDLSRGGGGRDGARGSGLGNGPQGRERSYGGNNRACDPVKLVNGNEEEDEVSKMQSQKKGSPEKVGHVAAAAVLTDVEASGDGRKKMSCISVGAP